MLIKLPTFKFHPGQPGISPSPGGVRCTPLPPLIYPPVTIASAGVGGGLQIASAPSGGFDKCFAGYEWDAHDRVCKPAKPKRRQPPPPPPRSGGGMPYQPPPPPRSGGERCVVEPPYEGQPYIPPRFTPDSGKEWNAGANSLDILDGDLMLRFIMPSVVGVVCGFTRNRIDTTLPERISHGFYFLENDLYTIIESGEERIERRAYTPMSTEFKALRINGIVAYYVDGVRVLTSRVQSVGQLSVGASLYSTGDSIP